MKAPVFTVVLLIVIAATRFVAATNAAVLEGGSAQDTALREAALFHNIEAVKAALKKDAHVNAPSSTGRPITPLGAVAMGTWREQRDRNVNLANNETARKLSQGGFGDDEIDKYLAVEITKLLFANGAKLGPFDRDILFHPIARGNETLVGLLLDHGASVTDKIEDDSPSELAKRYGQDGIYSLLVARGAVPVDSRVAAQLSLIEGAANGDLQRMEKALNEGANVNVVRSQQTALVAALRVPTYDPRWPVAAWWLLDHGADPNLAGELGVPLHVFISSNADTMKKPAGMERNLADITFDRLLKAGAKISGADDTGRTPLHVAAKSDNLHAAELLIKEGAKVMPRDNQRKTPLDYAESAAMIKLLKENGAVEQ
jgi:ankyrin repeat protein